VYLTYFYRLGYLFAKIIKFGGDLMKFWQKQVGSLFWHTLYLHMKCSYVVLLIMFISKIASVNQVYTVVLILCITSLVLRLSFCSIRGSHIKTRKNEN